MDGWQFLICVMLFMWIADKWYKLAAILVAHYVGMKTQQQQKPPVIPPAVINEAYNDLYSGN